MCQGIAENNRAISWQLTAESGQGKWQPKNALQKLLSFQGNCVHTMAVLHEGQNEMFNIARWARLHQNNSAICQTDKQANNKPWGVEGHRVAMIHYPKCPVSNKKMMRHAGESMTHTLEKTKAQVTESACKSD